MAPDRGARNEDGEVVPGSSIDSTRSANHQDSATGTQYATAEGKHFTLRGVVVGLIIGVVICFSNMYFGLQTGWISGMAMPSALLGFSYFKLVSRYINYPFSPVENVLIQSVAGSVGTMPLGCGFVGVIPALQFLLEKSEGGPLRLSLTKMIVFALGIAFFGVVFAVPLRKQVIIREKLKFPSGTAAALMIGVLHGTKGAGVVERCAAENHKKGPLREGDFSNDSLDEQPGTPLQEFPPSNSGEFIAEQEDWKARIRFLVYAFGFSSFYVCMAYIMHLNPTDDIRRHCSHTLSRSTTYRCLAHTWHKNGYSL
jgi:uncharacterized oligopeptide transporter (OPT) family protein